MRIRLGCADERAVFLCKVHKNSTKAGVVVLPKMVIFIAQFVGTTVALSGLDMDWKPGKKSTDLDRIDDGFEGLGEVTIKTKAAMNLVSAAKAMGVLDRLLLVLSRLCGRFSCDATDSPRLGERRSDKWHGEDGEKRDTEFEVRTSMEGSGGLKLSELPARERWRVLLQNETLEREERNSKKRSRED
jgi:hypothetical protein